MIDLARREEGVRRVKEEEPLSSARKKKRMLATEGAFFLPFRGKGGGGGLSLLPFSTEEKKVSAAKERKGPGSRKGRATKPRHKRPCDSLTRGGRTTLNQKLLPSRDEKLCSQKNRR